MSVNHWHVIVVSGGMDHGKGLLYVSYVCESLTCHCRVQSDGPRQRLAVCILCLWIIDMTVIVVSRVTDHGKGLLYVSYVCESLSYRCRIQSDRPQQRLAVCILSLCIIDISMWCPEWWTTAKACCACCMYLKSVHHWHIVVVSRVMTTAKKTTTKTLIDLEGGK